MTKKRTPRLSALIDRVESVCDNKAALARELGVSRHHVHYWVTLRANEPGGEITLHLLEWVRREEVKQRKNRRSAQTPRRPKTRSTQSDYERSKTGPS